MAKGGARPGAGRKKGVINKLSAAMREAARKTGLLPHESLLAISQGRAPEVFGFHVTTAVRIDAMKAAAPFYAPKLIAVAVKASASDNPYEELLNLADGKSRGLPGLPAPGNNPGDATLVRRPVLAFTKPVLDKERKR